MTGDILLHGRVLSRSDITAEEALCAAVVLMLAAAIVGRGLDISQQGTKI